ncbi:MAG: PAS domain-containing protein [Proteobacteria bacterium]|nr:PAS domain-containing protein [Pseudomonadota bacterium]MDA1058680.1 PAS domain-containing protein [Pseudomonadota bacterium]
MTVASEVPKRPPWRRGRIVYLTLWATLFVLFVVGRVTIIQDFLAIEKTVKSVGHTTAIELSQLAADDAAWQRSAAAEAILTRALLPFPAAVLIPGRAVRVRLDALDGNLLRSVGGEPKGPTHRESIIVQGPAGPVALLSITHSLRPPTPLIAVFILLLAVTGVGGLVAFRSVHIAEQKDREARYEVLTKIGREKQAEAADAHGRLAIILEATSDGFALFDQNDHLVLWNHAFARLNGEVAKVLRVGLSVEEMTWAMADLLPVLTRTAVRDWLNERMHNLSAHAEHTSIYKTPEGTLIRSFERRASDGRTVATLTDITELTRKDREIEKSERQLRLISDSLPFLVSLIDRDGRFRFVNLARAASVGRLPEQMVGHEWSEFYEEADAASLGPILDLGFCGESVSQEMTLGGGAAQRHYAVSVVPHLRRGEVDAIFVFGIDVTDRRRLEEQLRQAQKMETLGQLTGGIAHDFNNLLTVVLGNLDLAEEALPEELPATGAIRSARRGALRAAELTQRLLAFSRRQMLQPSQASVSDLIGSFADLLVRSLGERIEVRLSLGESVPATMVDAGQLENAVLNLTLNARDAMPEGGMVTIETATAIVDPARRLMGEDRLEAGSYVTVAVTDNGSGMSADVVSRAFDPFFTTKDVGKGSGLGLSMIYGFARQSGGGAEIVTAPGRGTTVTLYFPTSGAKVRAPEMSNLAAAHLPHGDERLFVVEDDNDVREHIGSSLRSLGYDVVAAADGKTAIDLLRSNGKFDLIVSDVVLPGGMDGEALVRNARTLGFVGPVLFTTGYARGALKDAARDVEILMKPYSREDLALRVRRLLDATKKSSAAAPTRIAADS